MGDGPSRGRRTDTLALLILSVPLVVERAFLIGRRAPTAADETLYVMQALGWLGRFTKLSSDAHRTWGVPAIIAPIAAATDNVAAFRIAFAALSIALCAVVYLVGRESLDPIPAAFAALMLGLASTTLLGSVMLLPDVAAALGVATAFLLYWRRVVHVPPGEQPASLWPVGVAVGSVLYFNIAFAAFAAFTLAVDFAIFRRRDLFRRPMFSAAFGFAAAIAPYFLTIWVRFGDPTHTLRQGLRGFGSTSPAGDPGYVLYARWFFDSSRFFGPFWGALVLAGIATIVFALIRGTPIPRRDAAALGLWLVVPTFATAFSFHAEARYMLPWFPAFFLALALPVHAALRRLPGEGSARTAGVVAVAGVVITAAAVFGASQYRLPARRMDNQVVKYGFVHRTAERLADSSAGPPCRVYTRFPREFELHTGCRTAPYNGRDERELLRTSSDNPTATYFVWWTGLVGNEAYQPSYLEGFFKRYTTLAFTADSGSTLGTAYVYRFSSGRVSAGGA